MLGGLVGVAAATSLPLPAFTITDGVSREMILNDPEAPWTGAANGDVTIVAFLDYCPFCKGETPALDRLVREDGRLRLVYKDWPIRGLASVHGAQMALAAARQNRYREAHHTLIGAGRFHRLSRHTGLSDRPVPGGKLARLRWLLGGGRRRAGPPESGARLRWPIFVI